MPSMEAATDVLDVLEGNPVPQPWASGVLAANEGSLVVLLLRFIASSPAPPGRPPSSTRAACRVCGVELDDNILLVGSLLLRSAGLMTSASRFIRSVEQLSDLLETTDRRDERLSLGTDHRVSISH